MERPNVSVLKIPIWESANPAKNLETSCEHWRQLRTRYYRLLPSFTVYYRGFRILFPPNSLPHRTR